MLSAAVAADSCFIFVFARTYADAVKSKPQVVVLSDSDQIGKVIYTPPEEPCAQYGRKCSEHRVKQDNCCLCLKLNACKKFTVSFKS